MRRLEGITRRISDCLLQRTQSPDPIPPQFGTVSAKILLHSATKLEQMGQMDAFSEKTSIARPWLLAVLLYSYLLLYTPVQQSPILMGASFAIVLWFVEQCSDMNLKRDGRRS